jgi:type II secretory pathway pseudopilin PulG
MKSRSAFTYIEVILVVVLLTMLSLPLLFNYLNVSNKYHLQAAVTDVSDAVRTAHVYSREGQKQEAWGVHTVNENTFEVIRGSSQRFTVEATKVIPNDIKFKNAFTVWFTLGTGETAADQEILLESQKGQVGQIIVYKTGVLDIKIK